MSHRLLLIIPGDLREAAGVIEQHGSQIEHIAGALRREWEAFSRANDFGAESNVAGMCQRAFDELARSQRICAELARALRLTAEALEDADRRAAGALRRDWNGGGATTVPLPSPWSGGGNAPGGSSGGGGGGFGGDDDKSLSEMLKDAFDFSKMATSVALLLGSGELVWKSVGDRRYLSFSLVGGQISPYAMKITGGVAKTPTDFARRVKEMDLKAISKPLWIAEKSLPLLGAAESVAKGDLLGVLPHMAAFGLQFAKHGEFLTGIPVGIYQGLTDPKYQDAREAAVIVKGLAPVASKAAGHAAGKLVGFGVTAVLTTVCPVGAPVWAVVGGAANLATSYAVEQGVKWLIKQNEDALINFLDTRIDSFKSNVDALARQAASNVLQAGEDLSRDVARGADALADFLGAARQSLVGTQ